MIVQFAPPDILNQDDWPVQGEWAYDDYLRLPDDGITNTLFV